MADGHHSKQTGNAAIHPAAYVGSSDPASPDVNVTADDKLWIDTTTGTTFATGWLLKIRSGSNTTWTTILNLLSSLALKANLASPTFTGVPSGPTAAPGTNTTQLATTAFVAATGGGDALTSGKLSQFASTSSSELAGVLSDETGSGGGFVRATGPTLSSPIVGTQTAADNSTKAASTAYADNAVAKQGEVLMFAVSDETTAITTGTAKLTFRMPYAMTLSAVRGSLTTVSSSGIPTVNIKESGTTIFSTKLTIDASELTSTTAATASVLSDTSLADDAQMTVDIDVAGTGATGLKIYLIGTRT